MLNTKFSYFNVIFRLHLEKAIFKLKWLPHKLHFNGFPFSWKEVSKNSSWRSPFVHVWWNAYWFRMEPVELFMAFFCVYCSFRWFPFSTHAILLIAGVMLSWYHAIMSVDSMLLMLKDVDISCLLSDDIQDRYDMTTRGQNDWREEVCTEKEKCWHHRISARTKGICVIESKRRR